jgi:hypothetical protein
VVWPWRRDRSPRGRRPSGVVPNDPGGPDRPSDPASHALSNPLSDPLLDPDFVKGLRPIPAGGGPDFAQPSAGLPASDVAGVNSVGEAVEIAIGSIEGRVLLAFLATKCDGCDAFWEGFSSTGQPARPKLPPDVSPVIVTKGPGTVSPEEVVGLATLGGTPVVMSDEAWDDYRVMGYPFLVLVDTSTRTVLAESVGFGWDDALELCARFGPWPDATDA